MGSRLLNLKTDSAFPLYESLVLVLFFAVLLVIAYSIKRSKKVKSLIKGYGSNQISEYKSINLDRSTRLLELSLDEQKILVLETDKGLVQLHKTSLLEQGKVDVSAKDTAGES